MVFITIYTYSQTTEIPLRQTNGRPANNSYLSDTFGDLDNFTGTYLYNENGVYFLFKLRKEIKYFNGFYYVDQLVGDLEYRENGITLLNTLSNFNITLSYQNPISHSIESDFLLKNHSKPECEDCLPNEIRLGTSIYDTRKYSDFILKRVLINGQQALKVIKFTVGPYSISEGQAPIENIISDKEYLFIKQP
jgi:hypothetical protein